MACRRARPPEGSRPFSSTRSSSPLCLPRPLRPPKTTRRTGRASAVHGLTSGHTLPRTAWTKVRPTQSKVHTVNGSGFASGSRLPASPAAMSTRSTTDAAAFEPGMRQATRRSTRRTAHRGTGNNRHRADWMARRSAAPRNRMTTRNDTATAAVPAAWKSPVGSSRMKPRSPACPNAGDAVAARASPASPPASPLAAMRRGVATDSVPVPTHSASPLPLPLRICIRAGNPIANSTAGSRSSVRCCSTSSIRFGGRRGGVPHRGLAS